MFRPLLLACALLLPGCVSAPPASSPQSAFFERLRSLCGNAYRGRVVTTDAADREIASQPLVMHVRGCTADSVSIPFHVGANRSRTWVISRTGAGLQLKHDHRHEDGSPDPVTNYGGSARGPGTALRQEFPADPFTLDLFHGRQMIPNFANVWAVEVEPGRMFAYELRRPNRHFRVEFDLSSAVPTPPPAWGAS